MKLIVAWRPLLSSAVRRAREESGAVAAEYAFLLALIAMVIIAGAVLVGSAIMNQLSAAGTAIGP